ncbi:MAG: asparaginase [Lachnospiraceae bacterium]|jgi:L-asparaginase|nr:asparaginase [Lachnospiraceae bacterium]
MSETEKKKILLIATGGTIASAQGGEGLSPAVKPEELLDAVPGIREICNPHAVQILNIDSTNLQPENWVQMVRVIRESYDGYDGFVITHGTDTMAYTASALSYLIQNADKPIVLTGSQKPIGYGITDAGKNLTDSFTLACEKDMAGVYLVFDGKAIFGTRARKVKSKSYDAFESVNHPPAALIYDGRVVRYFSEEVRPGGPVFCEEVRPSVFLLKLIPGMNPDVLEYVGARYDVIVIESYGVGGVPFVDRRNFLTEVERLADQGKIVVVATQALFEGSDMSVYEVGRRAMSFPTLLQSCDMTVESVVTKMMWLLGQTQDREEIRKRFYEPVNRDLYPMLRGSKG